MKLMDIKDAVIQRLTSSFPSHNIYGEDNGQELVKPALLAQIYPTSMAIENKYHRRKSVNVEIGFYSLNGTNQEDLEVADILYEALDSVMVVNDKKFTLGIIQTMIINDILTFYFNLDFIDSIDETKAYNYEEYELMGELEMKEEF